MLHAAHDRGGEHCGGGADARAPEAQFSTVCGAGALLPFDGHLEKWAMLAWTIFRIAFWALVAGYLHRVKWYWAL